MVKVHFEYRIEQLEKLSSTEPFAADYLFIEDIKRVFVGRLVFDKPPPIHRTSPVIK